MQQPELELRDLRFPVKKLVPRVYKELLAHPSGAS